jgi:predicted ATP-grasp superfamily ATP-dependent carboligase
MTVVRCSRVPALRAPIALLSFGGWGDAAQASSTAVTTLSHEWSAQQFATIDPEDFYDFTEVRPRVYLDQSMVREIEWPVGTFSFRRRPKAENDVVLFHAFEPQLRWQTYATGILDFFEKLRVGTMISLGALLADVPHTRPVHLTGFATTDEMQNRLREAGVAPSQYEGPTGIVGVLHDAARRRSIASASLWAAAPHYIAAAANPKVAIALLDTLSKLLDWTLDLSTLRQETKEFEVEVDAIISRNPEASAYVKRLEERSVDDDGERLPPPSNDLLMHELEEFLRRGREKPRGDA